MRKNVKQTLLFVIISFGLISCESDSTTEENFEEANENVVEKLIEKVKTSYSDTWTDNYEVIFNYDGSNRVSSVSDGESSKFFNYNSSGNLESISGSNEYTLNISELYQAPYDAFEKGDVREYDDNGNPIKIIVYDDGELLTGSIFYDPNPNPFFYALKASKILEILDQVELNFGYTSPTIVKARQLLPYNNISGMIFKDESNETVYEAQFSYTYDNDGYPTLANVNVLDRSESDNYTVYFTYK